MTYDEVSIGLHTKENTAHGKRVDEKNTENMVGRFLHPVTQETEYAVLNHVTRWSTVCKKK